MALAIEVLDLRRAAIAPVNAPASGGDAPATACNLSQSREKSIPATESSNPHLGYFTTSFEGDIQQLELEGAAVRRRYRELSALVHPDKCTHPDAEKVCGTTLFNEVLNIDLFAILDPFLFQRYVHPMSKTLDL